MIILAIICLMFFFITLCLLLIIIQLLKKKRLYKNKINNYPKLSTPIQMGLTSNQISSLGTIVSTNRDIKPQESLPTTTLPLSAHESNKTVSSINNDDEVETVNEVLGMEERNGKIYYKVNFTGHSSDYTAWVCEEDLIPE
ncbi:unnamed protein product [Rotaria magnacalcarata]|uniref:Chromo domain-containing protein n=2 Tax=Rotaria magnacalcarata TaxID=392030 RepID=A0A816RTF5_9BILA|nr:unnamed protein product [Rotaria magnacalcarata]CAF2079691.1 unnamed protein product [Rotaria magnacalcarata]CAF2148105.1 unnamed protein product [Rotaria magnacalcarata]